jgi:phosphoglycolate phosphatase
MIDQVLFDCAGDPALAVMIGDTTYDIQMAGNAGVRGVGVDWGYHAPRELIACGAEIVAQSPAQIGDHLLA